MSEQVEPYRSLSAFKAELNIREVEHATFGRVDWFSSKRLMKPLCPIPPVECEPNLHQRRYH